MKYLIVGGGGGDTVKCLKVVGGGETKSIINTANSKVNTLKTVRMAKLYQMMMVWYPIIAALSNAKQLKAGFFVLNGRMMQHPGFLLKIWKNLIL